MQIYLLRHGIAEEPRAGVNDADRVLLQEGEKKLRRVLGLASQAGARPEWILSSPYRRALQTAEIAQQELGNRRDILHSRALIPDAAPEDAWEEIRVQRNCSSLMLVGHNPLFSYLAGYLLGCPELQIHFAEAAILRVDIENFRTHPKGILCWYLTPKLAGESG